MTTDFESSTAFDEAFAAANSRVDRILGVVAERLGAHASAQAVFGDPIEREGITVIPVAKVRMGFGAGGGSGSGKDEDSGEGGGGGGGTTATPLGYIEISAAGAEFRPIHSWADSWPAILAAGAAVFLALRGLRALFR
jgi:uncharacterized spore protein YtfJ